MAEKVVEAELERIYKDKEREGVKRQWWPRNLNEFDLMVLQDEGFIKMDS
jgi:hypothetical protein